MQFESLSAFFQMGGYAFYVWLAYGVSALALFALLLDSRLKRRRVCHAVQQQQLRLQRQQQASKEGKL